ERLVLSIADVNREGVEGIGPRLGGGEGRPCRCENTIEEAAVIPAGAVAEHVGTIAGGQEPGDLEGELLGVRRPRRTGQSYDGYQYRSLPRETHRRLLALRQVDGPARPGSSRMNDSARQDRHQGRETIQGDR